jgi:MobA/VirD2-like, nuclease domain
MIVKGNQRSGGDDLASHLMNLYDNDAMELAEVRGTLAQDLHGALAEFEAHAAGTRCKQPLYSLSINPSEPMTRAQYFAAIDRIEDRLGFAGQPRAVVFYVKGGREHCHVVWSRIDTVEMRAVQLAHDRQKLRSVSQELAQELGHQLPDGLARNRGGERFGASSSVSLTELAQADRAGLSARERRADITAAFRQSDSAQAFVNALRERGYRLAQGDQRGFVVVDRAGHVHSLSRQIDGARAKDIKAKLAPRTPADLPTVKEVRQRIAAEREVEGLEPEGEPQLRRSPEQLKARQAERKAALTAQRQALELKQRQERMALHAAQKREKDKPFARAASAVLALIGKMPVLRSVLAPLYKNPKVNAAERHRLENEALDRRYERERKNLERSDQALGRVEARENRSLARDQRRLAEYQQAQRLKASAERHAQIGENAADITQTPAEKAQEQSRKQKQGARRNRPRGYGYRRE